MRRKKEVRIIYEKLFRHFGPQGWWPAGSPFEVMVGAILTQNTSWRNVEKAIANLKRSGALNLKRLHKMPARRLALLIKPAGYYNLKALRLKNFLNFLVATYRGDLGKMKRQPVATLRRELLAVKGIGPETADSILLYALGKTAFVVDAYTKRIFSRHKLSEERAGYEEVRNFISRNLRNEVELFNEYHALLVKLGKDYCLKRNPRCAICPLKKEA